MPVPDTNRTYYLYKITNNINWKVYYGIHSTNNLDDNYMGSGSILKKTYKKYGINNFTKEILYYANNIDELNQLEKKVVTKSLVKSSYCYNLVIGGKSKIGYNHTSEAKKKISKAFKGRKFTKETIDKIMNKRRLNDNYKHTIETKQKLRNIKLKIIGEKAPMYGKKHSEGTKLKISNAKIGIKNSEETKGKISQSKLNKKLSTEHVNSIRKGKQKKYGRKIIQLDLEDNFIKEWSAISQAARELNLYCSAIRKCCKKKRHMHGNYKWKYKT